MQTNLNNLFENIADSKFVNTDLFGNNYSADIRFRMVTILY